MLQTRGEQHLAIEPFRAHAREKLGRQHLHDDVALQRFLAREEHARHAAPAELARDAVLAAKGLLQPLAQLHTG